MVLVKAGVDGAHPLEIMRKKYVRYGVGALLIAFLTFSAALYCESYLTIRKDSGYFYTQSGKIRYRGGYGISATDMGQWSPKGCWWQPGYINIFGKRGTRGNFAGYLYSPLIAVDRRRNYPDIELLSVEDLENDPLSQMLNLDTRPKTDR